jgi:hypothetical protein
VSQELKVYLIIVIILGALLYVYQPVREFRQAASCVRYGGNWDKEMKICRVKDTSE